MCWALIALFIHCFIFGVFYGLFPPEIIVLFHLLVGVSYYQLCKLTGRVDYRPVCIRTHDVSGRSTSTGSFQLLVRVLAPITYRNELICSFNTFCTCIRPTGHLMSGIPLLFVREYALTL